MNCTTLSRQTFALALLSLPLVGCGSAVEATGDGVGSATDENSAASIDGPPRFSAPEGWVSEPPASMMRLLQFRIPAEGSDRSRDVEVIVAAWPTGVGPLESNLDRWVGQLGLTMAAADLPSNQRWTEEVRAFTVTILHLEGVIAPMQGSATGTATLEDAAMIAAFVETIGTQPVWTIKVMGPADMIAQHEAPILAFIRGL